MYMHMMTGSNNQEKDIMHLLYIKLSKDKRGSVFFPDLFSCPLLKKSASYKKISGDRSIE